MTEPAFIEVRGVAACEQATLFPERFERSGLMSKEVRAACREYFRNRLALSDPPETRTRHRLETVVTELLLNLVMYSPCRQPLPGGDFGAPGSITVVKEASGRYRVTARGFVTPEAREELTWRVAAIKKMSVAELEEMQVATLRRTSFEEDDADPPEGSGRGLLVVARTATELADPEFEESIDHRPIVRMVSVVADEAA